MESEHWQKGMLLMEVLIAVAILAAGIAASLRIFAASINSSARMDRDDFINQQMDKVYFEWLIDPTSFHEPAGTFDGSAKGPLSQLRMAVTAVPLVSQKEKEAAEASERQESQGNVPQQRWMQPAVINFFDTNFEVSGTKQEKLLSHHVIIAQYEKKT